MRSMNKIRNVLQNILWIECESRVAVPSSKVPIRSASGQTVVFILKKRWIKTTQTIPFWLPAIPFDFLTKSAIRYKRPAIILGFTYAYAIDWD